MVSRAILNGWPLVPPSRAVSAPSFTVQPSITGTFTVGNALAGNAGTATGFPTPTISRQWLRNGSAIPGATGASYTLTTADVGTRVDFSVTATSVAGTAQAIATGSRVFPADDSLVNVGVISFDFSQPGNLTWYSIFA